MNNIVINGKSFSVSGKNITVIGNQITVDGKVIQDGLSGIVEVSFTGDIATLKTNGSATINGNVQGDVDAGGSVACRDVGKNVDAGGSVNCGNVSGDIDAGGSVRCSRR